MTRSAAEMCGILQVHVLGTAQKPCKKTISGQTEIVKNYDFLSSESVYKARFHHGVTRPPRSYS
jgi:hypothetical protein